MTHLKIQIPANLPEETILSRLRQFLLSNTYYELESKGPLRFKNYPELRYEESPAAVQHELILSLSDNHIQYTYQAVDLAGYKAWESRYVDLLMAEMQRAIESGKIEMLELARLEKEAAASIYRPVPNWLNLSRSVIGGVAFGAILLFTDGFSDWRYWLGLGLVAAFALFYRLRYRRAHELPGSKNQ
ncbi:MAG: hypothetical protein H6574_23490 [Lewinellaceae bacterium]|nr:hypothetical protein [Saprospiraceae bacterium]MCB9334028.1 hypothetical protein [Lewinellaceae bacterium]